MVMLLPVQKSDVPRAAIRIRSVLPRIRISTIGRSIIWHNASLVSSPFTLSIEISGWPLSNAAPSRFSVSSSFAPAAITGIFWPVAIEATTSKRKLLPDDATGARATCIGVTENAPRTTGVMSADNATERATSSIRGNSVRRSASSARAVNASFRVGAAGIFAHHRRLDQQELGRRIVAGLIEDRAIRSQTVGVEINTGDLGKLPLARAAQQSRGGVFRRVSGKPFFSSPDQIFETQRRNRVDPADRQSRYA